MRSDLRLLAWLRWKLIRAAVVYWLSTFGYQPENRAFSHRVYVLYMLGYGLFWIVAMWSFAANQVLWAGSLLSPEVRLGIADGIPWLILIGQVVLAFQAAGDSPLKLSFEDIAYIAGSPLARGAVALVGFIRAVIPVLIVAAPAAAWTAMALNPSPEAAGWAGLQALLAVLPLAIFAWAVAWIVSLLRLAFPTACSRLRLRLAVLLVPLLAFIAPGILLSPGRMLSAAALGHLAVFDWATAWILAFLAGAAILALGNRVSLVDIADESAVFARIHALGLMAWVDPRLVQHIRQQAVLTLRRPTFHLSKGTGRTALLSRALLVYARRSRSLLGPLVWGAIAAQVCALLIFREAGMEMWITLLAFPILRPPVGLIRVFQNDREETFMRQFLPYGNLLLLLADAAAPAAAMLVGALGIWVIQPFPAGMVFSTGLLVAGVIALLILCQGASLIKLTQFRISIPYQVLVLLAFGSAIVAGFAVKTVLASIITVALAAIMLAAAIRSSPMVG